MEMVAAARLRRAEQRIAAMRPYAQAIRRMTQRVAEAAEERREPRRRSCSSHGDKPKRGRASILVTGDRGLAGSFNTPDHPRRPAARRRVSQRRRRGRLLRGRPPRHLVADLPRRGGRRLVHRLHRPPGLRQRSRDRRRGHRALRRRGARPGRADLQPLRLAADPVRAPPDAAAAAGGRGLRRGDPRRAGGGRPGARRGAERARSGSTSPSPRRR